MSSFVTTGALMTCTFGMVPCPLTVLPVRNVMLNGRPRANITDFAPITNIASFGMCSAPTNPAVIAATSAALGVFTPAPCIPAIVSPWMVGDPTVLVQKAPALTSVDRNMCMWLGQISFTNDGQVPLPGPICVAPPGKVVTPIPARMPLSSSDFSASGGGGGGSQQQQYKEDVKKAQSAGKQHDMMSNSFDSASKSLGKAGRTDSAAIAGQKAQISKSIAADKNSEAVGDVNQRYRETMPPSTKQMSQLTPQQQQSYQQQRNNITQQKQASYQQAEQERKASTQSPAMADASRDLKMHFADVNEQKQLKQLNTSTFKKN